MSGASRETARTWSVRGSSDTLGPSRVRLPRVPRDVADQHPHEAEENARNREDRRVRNRNPDQPGEVTSDRYEHDTHKRGDRQQDPAVGERVDEVAHI